MKRRRLLRAPSVEEYERMTQRARMIAARHLQDQLDQIQAVRDNTKPPAWRADEITPEETRTTAHYLLAQVTALWPEPPAVQADRRDAAVTEAYRPHPKERP